MRVASEIETRPIGGDAQEAPASSEVWLFGRRGAQVSGAVLETAVQTDAGTYLLFLTDDIPHEDFLSIHLLDAAGDLLDSATIGSPYSTGAFSLLRMEPPNKVHFTFIGETNWMIEVLPKPALRIPMLSEPSGVSRGGKLRRHFAVHGAPRPAS